MPDITEAHVKDLLYNIYVLKLENVELQAALAKAQAIIEQRREQEVDYQLQEWEQRHDG